MFAKLIDFFARKAQSPTNEIWLTRRHLPFFMDVAGSYRVVIGPKYIEDHPLSGAKVYRYGVLETYGNGPVHFFKAPFGNLPKEFLVRKLVSSDVQFEYISVLDRNCKASQYPPVENNFQLA